MVCPERAIIAGDLADPTSEISELIARHAVQVRKPEKGTRPKLFYINADEASDLGGMRYKVIHDPIRELLVNVEAHMRKFETHIGIQFELLNFV